MRRFEIEGKTWEGSDPGLPKELERAWRLRIRPMCLCKPTGVPCYIARIGSQYLIKRMPMTGDDHVPTCEAHGDPWENAETQALVGNAVQRNAATGEISLRLDFSLSKSGIPSEAERRSSTPLPPAAVATRERLPLIGLLLFLWNEADLNRWTVRWAGKRHWWTVRSHLLAAARNMTVHRSALASVLFIPEPFRVDDKAAIEQRRASALRRLSGPSGSGSKLMLILGEVKTFDKTRAGIKVIIRHLPDLALLLDGVLWKKLQAQFADVISLWNSDKSTHLVFFGTFGIDHTGLANVEQGVLIVTTENWIPFRTIPEHRLLSALSSRHEISVWKPAPRKSSGEPKPVAILPDHQPRPLAMFIAPAHLARDQSLYPDTLKSNFPDMDFWIWEPETGRMPPIPD